MAQREKLFDTPNSQIIKDPEIIERAAGMV
jgi:hypothetical protein